MMTLQQLQVALVDNAGNVWNVGPSGRIQVNYVTDLATANVVQLWYDPVNNLMYQQNALGGWWYKTSPTAPWTACESPMATVPGAPTEVQAA